jgi:hypothetical protein
MSGALTGNMTGGNRRGSSPAILVSCLALTLAACDLLQPRAAPTPAQTTAPAAVTALPLPPPRKPTPPGPNLARLPPPSAAPGAEPAGPAGFDRLIGLDQPHVADLLGDPHSRAESPPATIWQYAGTDCEVDVYFYLDLQSQTMRVLHYEVRSHDLPERSVQRCYDALASERRPPDESNAGSDRPR